MVSKNVIFLSIFTKKTGESFQREVVMTLPADTHEALPAEEHPQRRQAQDQHVQPDVELVPAWHTNQQHGNRSISIKHTSMVGSIDQAYINRRINQSSNSYFSNSLELRTSRIRNTKLTQGFGVDYRESNRTNQLANGRKQWVIMMCRTLCVPV